MFYNGKPLERADAVSFHLSQTGVPLDKNTVFVFSEGQSVYVPSPIYLDKDTVKKYIDFFVDAFILREASRYDVKGNVKIGALRKYFFIDNGLRNARLNFAYDDEGQMLENMVYNELIYNGYTVNVGAFEKKEKDKNGKSISKSYEIDFVAQRGIKKYYIQVANDISNLETKAREIKPFIALKDSIQKIIVINKPLDESLDLHGFTIIGVTDFLLRFIK